MDIIKGMGISLVYICCILYIPFLANMYMMSAISLKEWGMLFLFCTPMSVLMEEGRKAIMRWWDVRVAKREQLRADLEEN